MISRLANVARWTIALIGLFLLPIVLLWLRTR